MTDPKMVRLSEIWLFGTNRILDAYPYDEALEMAKHLHPDGRHVDYETMTDEDAAELLRTGIWPDAAWNRVLENEGLIEERSNN